MSSGLAIGIRTPNILTLIALVRTSNSKPDAPTMKSTCVPATKRRKNASRYARRRMVAAGRLTRRFRAKEMNRSRSARGRNVTRSTSVVALASPRSPAAIPPTITYWIPLALRKRKTAWKSSLAGNRSACQKTFGGDWRIRLHTTTPRKPAQGLHLTDGLGHRHTTKPFLAFPRHLSIVSSRRLLT